MTNSKNVDTTTLIITGVGGQGILLISQIIGTVAIKKGFKVRISETFGMSQRGGPVVSQIRLGQEVYSPLTPSKTADLMLGLEPLETLRRALIFLKPGGSVLMNTRAVYPVTVNRGDARYPPLDEIIATLRKITEKIVAFDATELALKIGNPIVMNVIMLGALASLDNLPFKPEDLREAIKIRVPRDIKTNLKAFDVGLQTAKKILS